jgi:transposase
VLILPPAVHIYLAAEPVDMRKGFDGLAGLVQQRGFDMFSGHLFVFMSKQRNRVKILTWSTGGFVLLHKRLEKGRFRLPLLPTATVQLDASQLAMLLDGIDLKYVRRSKLWKPPQKSNSGIDIRSCL